MSRQIASKAEVLHTLVFYDGPQLLLLKTDSGMQMIAVAVTRNEMQQPFFGCEVRPVILQKYLSDKADLHYVFNQASRRRMYFFDLAMRKDSAVPLERAAASELENQDFWPEPGFFARSHTDPIDDRQISGGERVFKIDGAWEPRDFSRFYNKIEDLYAFLFVTKRIHSGQISRAERGYVRRAIETRFWRGGGSYVGFYDDLSARVQNFNPIRVSSISYASPGQIVFRGESSVFAEIDETLASFAQKQAMLSETYSRLNSVLSKEKVRSKRASSFSSDSINDYVTKETSSFASALQINNADDLYKLCGNPVVFCKVVLSFYRRANELNTFQAEGRVGFR